jgi:hypothetical protein
VIVGDLNADAVDGDSTGSPVTSFLLEHPRVADARPSSDGGSQAARSQAGSNATHRGPPELDTGDFPDRIGRGPGNLRTDYVLPSNDLEVIEAGVFWPQADDEEHAWLEYSDHRLVWVDVRWPPAGPRRSR